MDLPSTINIQWQRLLLGSLIWEDLYYGDVPILEQFRNQVAQDHKDLLSHIRSGLDDPYVVFSLSCKVKRGFYIPFDVFTLIKTQTEMHQSSPIHLYSQSLFFDVCSNKHQRT